ncbi:MAG TPA: FHA domain-containing protein [Gemmataceae bacterium]
MSSLDFCSQAGCPCRAEGHYPASLNGTFVNDQRIQLPVRLHSGDGIRIGPVEFLFVAEKDCPPDDRDPNYPDTAILE